MCISVRNLVKCHRLKMNLSYHIIKILKFEFVGGGGVDRHSTLEVVISYVGREGRGGEGREGGSIDTQL